MEYGIVPAASIAGMVFSMILVFVIPIGLLVYMIKKYSARLASFFIGVGIFVGFALILEQLLHYGVFALVGQDKLMEKMWVYALYGATAAAVFEETGRFIAMKFFMKKNLDRTNAFTYGIGHGGVEAIIIVGLSSFNNIATSIAINIGAIQQTMDLLDDELKQTTFEQISQLWTLPSYQFYLAGIERVSAMIAQAAMSLFMYKGVKFGKKQYVALAFVFHFVLDFVAVMMAKYSSIALTEVIVFALAIGGAILAYLLNRNEEPCEE